MVGNPQDKPKLTDEQAQEMLLVLRRKQGDWVEWADLCQSLQGSGYNPQQIFEATGFEPIQQNQILGAAQVYASMVKSGVAESTAEHFKIRASDVLYEFRTLSPNERAVAAEFAYERKMDSDDAKELGKAMKDFSRLSKPPEHFSGHPGDVLAYYAWFGAKQKSDLQQRAVFIAKGLKFAHTPEARKQIEQLLTDFSTIKPKAAPRFPIYRLEADEEMPRMIPMVEALTVAALRAIPQIDLVEPFAMVNVGAVKAWVPVPGWQIIRTAKNPVAALWGSDVLPEPLPGEAEPTLVIIDRGDCTWSEDSYFICGGDALEMKWFETPPEAEILGRVILMVRPKKVLDLAYGEELWQFEE
jgi:hypothetical protein